MLFFKGKTLHQLCKLCPPWRCWEVGLGDAVIMVSLQIGYFYLNDKCSAFLKCFFKFGVSFPESIGTEA